MSDKVKDDLVFVQHILDSISKIEEYTSDTDLAKFKPDSMRQDACIRQVEIIGEAAKKLSLSFREKHNSVPWKEIAGMRDKLIHDYLGVDIEQVWETIQKDIPVLKEILQGIARKK